ncbi:uncharacterized protein RCO7_14007 [Rhynchosporium graminicola]|uniref:Uncharacterized protein n=2 Tax=Rhynchosporium TaxID=38037 RepID=A0A1E1M8G4_RHYSE|nr:uncharacterized protein RCO7_14007 [Rhynchosporium commune]CZT45396.1 uncharacterized protein RSE6_05703 [Rhynchosporium secalis]
MVSSPIDPIFTQIVNTTQHELISARRDSDNDSDSESLVSNWRVSTSDSDDDLMPELAPMDNNRGNRVSIPELMRISNSHAYETYYTRRREHEIYNLFRRGVYTYRCFFYW